MINYSIIIPHKNIPDLLQRCLNSIPQRDDLQVIIVDDNSDPSIVDFKKFPGINRSNTEVILTKEGKGAGYARNVGLKNAKGKWILFADADDFYEKEFNIFLEDSIHTEADCIFFSVNSVDSDSLQPSTRNFLYNDYFKKYKKNTPHSEDWILYNKWEPWNKMISRDFLLLNEIKFDEVSKCNDMIFSCLVSYYARKIKFVKKEIYCVTSRKNSITTKKSTIKEYKDCITAFMKKDALVQQIGHPEWKEPLKKINFHFFQKERIHTYLFYRLMYYVLYPTMVLQKHSFKKKLKKNAPTKKEIFE